MSIETAHIPSLVAPVKDEKKEKAPIKNRAFGINELLDAEFDLLTLDPEWVALFGKIESNCTILICGAPKNGKTDFCIKFTKQLAKHEKRSFYNSFEEGKSATLKEAVRRNNMQDCSGKIMFGNRESFDHMMSRMSKPRSGNCLFIDSWDYMKLTAAQFKKLREKCKNKMIVIICWAHGDRPDDAHAKKIEHMADVIIRVKDYKAVSVDRFGGNGEFVIWDKPREPKKVTPQGNLFETP